MAQATISDEAFVTLATNNSYAMGALALGHSLLQAGTKRKLVCMVTKQLGEPLREEMKKVYEVVEVDVMDSNDSSNLALLQRPDLGITFTKLNCWKLVQFKKCVFLDADTLVLKNIDDLFEREELSASADIGWPDCFNSGVFVFTPSHDTYFQLLDFALQKGSYDGGDQGLLNGFFSDWATKDIKHHLPFLYNVVANDFYTYLPALKRYGKDAKVVHFIGARKPWMHDEATLQGDSFYGQFLQTWWSTFRRHVDPSSQAILQLTIQAQGTPVQERGHVSEQARRGMWEQGQIDYTGVDSFHFIQQQIDSKVIKKVADEVETAVEHQAQVQQQSPPVSEASPPSFKSQATSSPISIRTATHQPSHPPTQKARSPTVTVVTKARANK